MSGDGCKSDAGGNQNAENVNQDYVRVREERLQVIRALVRNRPEYKSILEDMINNGEVERLVQERLRERAEAQRCEQN
jgi:hypothetical protein